MLPEGLREPVWALFSICVAAAAMDMLAGDRRTALSFRSLCALAMSLCALRVILNWIKPA